MFLKVSTLACLIVALTFASAQKPSKQETAFASLGAIIKKGGHGPFAWKGEKFTLDAFVFECSPIGMQVEYLWANVAKPTKTLIGYGVDWKFVKQVKAVEASRGLYAFHLQLSRPVRVTTTENGKVKSQPALSAVPLFFVKKADAERARKMLITVLSTVKP